MNPYNADEVDKVFNKGKSHGDHGHYSKSISIYDGLITYCEKFKDNEHAFLALEMSLNNRGFAKCKLGLLTINKQMYVQGMDDYEASYKLNPPGEVLEGLTAYNNYQYSREEVKKFDIISPTSNNILSRP